MCSLIDLRDLAPNDEKIQSGFRFSFIHSFPFHRLRPEDTLILLLIARKIIIITAMLWCSFGNISSAHYCFPLRSARVTNWSFFYEAGEKENESFKSRDWSRSFRFRCILYIIKNWATAVKAIILKFAE